MINEIDRGVGNNTPDKKRKILESISMARGGLFLLLRPHIREGMSSRDVVTAVFEASGVVVNPKNVSAVISKARVRGDLPALTTEQKSKISSRNAEIREEKRPKEERVDNEAVLKIVERKGTIQNVMDIMGYKRAQVNRSLIRENKRQNGNFSYYADDRMRERRQQAAHFGQRKDQPPSEQESKARRLAKRLLEAKLINRLSEWEHVNVLLWLNNLKVESMAQKLILEALLTTKKSSHIDDNYHRLYMKVVDEAKKVFVADRGKIEVVAGVGFDKQVLARDKDFK